MPKPKTDTVEDVDAEVQDDAVEMVEFDFRGVTFRIPRDRDEWDTEAFIAISHGDPYVSLQLIIGPEQWTKLRRIGTSRRITKEFSELFGEVAARECIN